MKISFCVAVYQNKGAVSLTHEKIRGVFTETLTDDEYEIVFVDDGSTDGSLDELISLHEEDPQHVRVVTFTRNFGQMAAILAGLHEATGDAIINVSADLQDPISLIPEMVQKWKSGDEIVICHRRDRADDFLSRLYSKFAYGLLRIAVPSIPEGGFDFVLMDRNVVDVFNSIDVRHRFFQGDLLWTGYRTSLIPYVRIERTIGKSQYNFSKKLKNFLDGLIDASYLPIRFISMAGIITAGLGLFYAFTIVIAWFFGDTPFTGWAPLMIVILLVGGMIMVMLGVIGEYIWRINEEVRKRPNYLIRRKYP